MQARRVRIVMAGLLGAFSVSCVGGNVYYRQGRKAELRKDYDTALVDFEKALQSSPENAQFLIHARNARTEASLFHRKQGERLLADGRPDEAAGEFQKAVGIDPTNQSAAQELNRILTKQAEEKQLREQQLKQAMKPPAEEAPPGTVHLKPLSQETMGHVRLTGDAKSVYKSLGALGDLNVAFLSEFHSAPVSLDLTNIKIEDALRVLAYETRTFWKVVTPNTILVIPDNVTTHREFDDRVLKTIYLTNPLQPADRTQLISAVKQILLLQQVVDNPDANAIIVSGTSTQVEAAEKMIHDLDRGKAEVLIEVAIMEADRDRIRDLGLVQVPSPPLSGSNIAGLGFNPPSTSTSSTSTTIPTLPLNKLGRISTADFSIVLPGAVANALMNDTHTHILQNPEIRTTDGQKAELKIGQQVPYATGSFLPSFGGATTGGTNGLGLLSTTQFQYKDVGVNLLITPHVLPDGEVALHAKVEILAVGAPVLIGGLSQPTFTQRSIEHDIRMKEGEVNLLGGLIQSTSILTVEGLPGLGDIPILRYFFSTEHRERSEQEILVMLTPHIVRLPEVSSNSPVAVGAGSAAPALNQPPGLPPQPGVPQ